MPLLRCDIVCNLRLRTGRDKHTAAMLEIRTIEKDIVTNDLRTKAKGYKSAGPTSFSGRDEAGQSNMHHCA